MSDQGHTTVDVFYGETYYADQAIDKFKYFEPLANRKLEVKERIAKTLAKLEGYSTKNRDRFETLIKCNYGEFPTIVVALMVTPHHHSFEFGEYRYNPTFIEDFCFFLFSSLDAEEVRARLYGFDCLVDYDRKDNKLITSEMEFILKRDSMWRTYNLPDIKMT